MALRHICLVAGGSLKNNQRSVLVNFGKLLENQVCLDLVVGQGEKIGILEQYYTIYRSATPKFDPAGLMSSFAAAKTGVCETKADIILNVSHPFPLGVAVVLCGWFKCIPVLLRMTGDPFSERILYNNSLVRLRKKIVHEFLLGRRIYSKATLIIPVGKNLANILKKIGIPKNKIYVRPQPFDARPFQPAEMAEKLKMRERLGLDPNRRTVLFVGSLTWGKGIDRLATIINLIESRSDDFQFCVLGNGPAVHYVKSINSQWIKLPGNVSREEVIKYFRAADVLIHPSRRDALPNVILEAIASGIPVIASPVGEIPHYVSNIAETEEQFVELLLSDQLVIDSLPSDMDWEKQKEDYLKLFNLAIVRGSKYPKKERLLQRMTGEMVKILVKWKRFRERARGRLLNELVRDLSGRVYSKPSFRRFVSKLFPKRYPQKWVFIIGCYNSGTTLLREMLGSHPQIATLPREGVRFTDQFPDLQSGGWQRMLLKNQHIWEMPFNNIEQRTDRIIRDWSPLWKPGAKVFLEKSIEHAVRISWLETAFKSPYFITIVRNGYCVCEGIRRKAAPRGSAVYEMGTEYPVPLVAEQWVKINNEIEKQTKNVKHVYPISYENLVDNPIQTMHELLDFIGVSECLIEKNENDIKIGNSKFRISNMNPLSLQRLSSEDFYKANSALSDALKRYGYPVITQYNK